MTRRLPPLNALRAFEAAGRHGSFSKAGEELNVSHSSISRHVRGLEKRLGVQLFKTILRGVEITEDGKRFLESTTNAFDTIEEATEKLALTTSGKIVVSCEPTFTLKWLILALGSFQQKYPDIEVIIHDSHELANLHKNECDLAIRFCRQDYPGLEADLISHSPVFPVGSPSLATSEKKLFSPEELLEFPILLENHDLWRCWFAEAGRADLAPIEKSRKFKTTHAIEAAIAGHGLALVSMDLVSAEIKNGRLMRFSDIELGTGAYKLLYLKKSLRRQSVKIFRDWLLEESNELRAQ